MSKTFQLLKQVRRAAAAVNATTDNPEHKTLLAAVDTALGELMLRDAPDFHLGYLRAGKALLAEGNAVAASVGCRVVQPHELRDDLSAEASGVVIDGEVERLHRCLSAMVQVLDEARSAREKDYLVRLSDWEATLYNHSAEISDTAAHTPSSITRDAFLVYLVSKFPQWRGLKITKFMPLDGGFSKKTVMVETEDDVNGAQAMVIRAEQPVDILGYEGSDLSQEFHMIQLMRKSGLPIAEPLWLELDRTPLGARFIVSRKAQGKTYGGNFGSNEALSADQVQSMMTTFIKMHNVSLDPADPLVQKSHLKEWLPTMGSLRDTIRYYVSEYLPRVVRLTEVSASPQLTRCLQWLQRNVPEVEDTPVIVHGDYSFNNLIFDGAGITAVLDWESSRLGDPADDVLYTQMVLDPYIPMADFLAQYKAGTGREISEYRMAYSRVAKCANSGMACLSSLRAIETHDGAHINIATLAYRYLAMFGSSYNKLIAAAEAVKPR